MQLTALCQTGPELAKLKKNASNVAEQHPPTKKTILLAMKLTAIILLIGCLHVSANGITQVTFSGKDVPLEKVFEAIKKQTSYSFLYNSDLIKKARPVTIEVKNMPVEQVLSECLKGQPFDFTIENKTIFIIQRKTESITEIKSSSAREIEVRGIVSNEEGTPLEGVSVMVKGTNLGTYTNSKGEYFLKADENAKLTITSIGYSAKIIDLRGREIINIELAVAVGGLDQLVIIGYGKTSNRYNTGSVVKVTSQQISRQPISNPLASLQGRVTGLQVTQSNGLPGSTFNVMIRGRHSLNQGTQPLFIIDGVPFRLNSGSLSQIDPTIQDPFNNINPADIESIEVLKDADATAIYGSQGANGVILITTKQASAGKAKVDVSVYAGISEATRSINVLGTQDYIKMRKEAFSNDGFTPNALTAPDLIVWDTTKYTDWKELLIGGTGNIQNIQASVSGGTKNTKFLLSSNYLREETLFPGNQVAERASVRLNVNQLSNNNKFRLNSNWVYSFDKKNLPGTDLATYTLLPPNAPEPLDSNGKLVWVTGIQNPMSFMFKYRRTNYDNLINTTSAQYELLPDLVLKANFGFSYLQLNEVFRLPIAAQRPSASTYGTTQVATQKMRSWLFEPQITYKRKILAGTLELLAGGAWQRRKQDGVNISGTQYTNDDLLGNLSSAGLLTATNSFSEYRYTAAFGRVSYNLKSKYLFNFNIRRDGSSRFGPAKRFANFGAIGLGWIFSEEQLVKKSLPFLSYGKIRTSFGVTGNDQIRDYQYFDSWTSQFFYEYQGIAGIMQGQLFNPTLEWERNKKFEIGLELGIINDRVLISASYYRNRSDNQLVPYQIPSQTGFTSIVKNIDALIQNKGLEIQIHSQLVQHKKFRWEINANVSFPKNKLLKYPLLEISSDKYRYVIGEPLDIIFGFQYLNVNSATGKYDFTDVDNNGIISSPNDLKVLGRIGQRFFGGLENTLKYGNLEFNLFFQFVSQTGRNYLANLATVPGALGNQPDYVLNRWTKPGDLSEIQRFTRFAGNPAFMAYNNFRNSSALIQDASFVRLKNVSLVYNLSKKWLTATKFESAKIYFQGQNILTITNYKGADPENQSLLTLPPLRVLSVGVQFVF